MSRRERKSRQSRKREAASAPAASRIPGIILIVVIVLVAMGRLCAYDFTNWDDNQTVAQNPAFNPPTLAGVMQYWRKPFMDLYVPVTYVVWGLVASLAYDEPRGLDPRVFHTFNVLLHTFNSALVFLLLQRLLPRAAGSLQRPGNPSPALIGALLFAVHPVQVESVAWISGMKDLLCGTLTLSALLGYTAFAQSEPPNRWRPYLLGTLAFALAMLSKPTAVVAPVMVGIIGRFVLRRPIRDIAVSLLPWIILAVPCVIGTKLVQPAEHVAGSVPLFLRPLVAIDALAFYLGKILFPWKLAIDYGRTPDVAIERRWIYFTWLAPMAILVALWFVRRRVPMALAAAGLAVAGLLPVLGLIRFDFQEFSTVGDHYLYLPMFGVAVLIASCLTAMPARKWGRIAAIVIGVLMVRSIVQAGHWRDSVALAEHTLHVNPDSRTGNNNLAAALLERNQFDKALAAARRAVELNPADARARATLAAALAACGFLPEAEAAYRQAIELDPLDTTPAAALARMLAQQGRGEDAIAVARRMVQVDSSSPDAHAFLGMLLARAGKSEEAKQHLEEALRLEPAFQPARLALEQLRGKRSAP